MERSHRSDGVSDVTIMDIVICLVGMVLLAIITTFHVIYGKDEDR